MSASNRHKSTRFSLKVEDLETRNLLSAVSQIKPIDKLPPGLFGNTNANIQGVGSAIRTGNGADVSVQATVGVVIDGTTYSRSELVHMEAAGELENPQLYF